MLKILAKLDAIPRLLLFAWVVGGPFLWMLFRELFKDRVFGNANNWLDQNMGPIMSAIASSALWLVWMAAFGGILIFVWWVAKRSMEQPLISLTTPAGASSRTLIDPWLETGKRTFVRVLIDQSNWRAEALKKENVFEVKAQFIDEEKTAVRLVIIFDRWTLERGARISADNRLEGYRTAEEVMTERYAMYAVYGIRCPCIITVEFQSGISPPEDEESTPQPHPDTAA